jgi:hypothetical protein
MGPTALLPSEGRRAEDSFFALKNPTASVGFEPANLGAKGQTTEATCYTLAFVFDEKARKKKTSVGLTDRRHFGRIRYVEMAAFFAGSRDKVSVPISLL